MVSTSVLSKPNLCETRQIRLTSRLLHIGSAVPQLGPFEYVQTGKFVYLSKPDALARALQARGFLNDYIQRIQDQDEITSLLENAFGKKWWTASDTDGEPLFPKHLRSLKWADRVTELRPMIRNGFGQFYIPGSSIKGAIRTAIAYHLLKYANKYNVPGPQRPSQIEQRLRQSMGELKRRAKFADDPLFMETLFSDFSLRYQGQAIKARTRPNTDFMRAIQVSDASPLIEERIQPEGKRPFFRNLPIVSEVVISSHYGNNRAKYRASIYAEMVLNVRSHFTLSLDYEMLKWFRHNQQMSLPFKSIEDVLNICREFAQDQWDFEHDYWANVKNNPDDRGQALDFNDIRDIYEPEQCPHTLRIGWASGLMGTTINLLIPDDTVAKVRDTCGISAPNFEAPKSRRTVKNHRGEIRYVPGWVKLEMM
ncbi:type III-A CRISPR-associated RAMP protein Csm5 [Adonisia turfae]|uniref:CRISPR system Cms protein Csm5 n=1 Tax=Adonisia turfae CCMR0081 TaxID=2292702 RepID=A0A6M0RR20_9CYAN|nr:type III-A CRISPR-associated RAMP protein Csm5 [Adonisia turfae]NEZ58579.1 type III-A CRISPR-associated RAMP protein Csm5 [Adonisia turfae CCMR0081]